MSRRPLIDHVSARLLDASGGRFDFSQVRIGNHFGLYRALAEGGPSTALELSIMTGLREKHLTPWLEGQARTGFLDRSGCAAGIRYRLAADVRGALLDARALEAMFGDDCGGLACRMQQKPLAALLETSQVVPDALARAA